jgi:PPOX class probable F420-dependent enzyme
MKESSMTTLPEAAKALFDAAEFVTLATVQPDGQPQLSVVWVERDGDDLLMSTTTNRQKHRNLEGDPRATVLLYPKDNPYSYVEVRGSVSMTEQGGRELIDRLNQKYMGTPRYTWDDGTDNVRVVVRLSPTKVNVQ